VSDPRGIWKALSEMKPAFMRAAQELEKYNETLAFILDRVAANGCSWDPPIATGKNAYFGCAPLCESRRSTFRGNSKTAWRPCSSTGMSDFVKKLAGLLGDIPRAMNLGEKRAERCRARHLSHSQGDDVLEVLA
jgi:hypothetical protein